MLQKVQHNSLYHLINLRYFDHTAVQEGGLVEVWGVEGLEALWWGRSGS